jgi:simple sugar transport system ATP-binding protein
VLTGLIKPDRGSVSLAAGVACVYQHPMVVPGLTVAENVFLNRPVGADRGLVRWRAMRTRARQVMLEWGFDLDVDRLAEDLTVEQRQMIEIARALSIGTRFLILDEPTAALEAQAIRRLFERLRRLKESGVGILYISHHLEEIAEVCERVTVLRDGRRVVTGPVRELAQPRLVAAMVGDAVARTSAERGAAGPAADGPARLRVSGLSVRSPSGDVDGVSLEVRQHECVGLVGLRGSGAVTVADAVVGLARRDAGEVRIDGRAAPAAVGAVLRLGVGYVPEDRHARGFVPQLGVAENLTLTVLDRLSRWGLVSAARRARLSADLVRRLDIVASGPDQPAGELSGGNQQKVVVGRALAGRPSVLVVVGPTIGVDVASKEALLATIDEARREGMAVLLVSDDLDDLRICDRLLVMARGRLVRELTSPPWDRHEVIAAAEGMSPAR